MLTARAGRFDARRAGSREVWTALASWSKASSACRLLEQRARAALREGAGVFGPATEALFDLVAESDLLPLVAPRGQLPRDFAVRCRAAARRRTRALRAERVALDLALSLTSPGARKIGRRDPANEPHLDRSDLPRRLLSRLAGEARRYPGEPEEGLAPGELAIPGTDLLVDRRGRLLRRETIVGSSIVLGARLESLRTGLRIARGRPPLDHADGLAGGRGARGAVSPTPQSPPPRHSPRSVEGARRLRSMAAVSTSTSDITAPKARAPETGSPTPSPSARRLGRALALVAAAWPEAAREIRARTRLIIPLEEPGLVSYSLQSRPGVSYINLRRKTLIDLADDLLHESAHHRLHALEDARALFRKNRPGPAAEDLRIWSPWRRAPRPVRGIAHACYTFAFRAELFERILRAARAEGGKVGPLRVRGVTARRLASEARTERAWILACLRDLGRAPARARLTAAGARLLGTIRAAVSS